MQHSLIHPHPHLPGLSRFGVAALLLAGSLLAGWTAPRLTLYQERFEDDGEGTRWVTQGRGKLDPQPPPQGFAGPSFWELNVNVSFVGVRANAPAKRAAIVWHHLIPADRVSADFLRLFDAAVDWLAAGRVPRTVLFSPPPAGPGDQALVDRLTARGFTVLSDATASPPPDAATIGLVIQSSSAVPDPTRFTGYPAPLISYNASNHDDELVSSIGTTETIELGPIRIDSPAHPAAGGLTGSITAVTATNQYDVIGMNQPSGATIVASYDLVSARRILTLADADQYLSGALSSDKTTGTVAVADLAIGEPGRFTGAPQYDNPPPGNPDGARTFATRGTGKIQVLSPGTWTFAAGVDDGVRLRIDRDRNGFGPGDNVFNEEDGTGFRVLGADVTFSAAGVYDFEWVGIGTGANYGQEVAVALLEGGATVVEPWDPFSFNVLGESDVDAQIKLMGDITVVTYMPTAVLREPRPFLTVVESGASLLGGPLTGFEGRGFWAGADLNEPSYEPAFATATSPRSLTLSTVNVRGHTNVQVTVAVAGSDVDFEDPDFLRIAADPDGEGPAEYVELAHFRQFPTGHPNRGALGDTNDNQQTVLRAQFKEVTYNIPNGATDLRLRFEGHCTFFNEVMAFDNVRVTVPDNRPLISIRRVAPTAVITYTGTLQSAPNVDGTYLDVAGATSPYTIPSIGPGTRRFYRARN